ncbi:MAG: Ig-like domain-containing protein, partial [Fidelibacterota bacterium]
MGPPPGGPVDETAPFLVSSDPPSGTTRIEPGLTVGLTFSERLNESTFQKGIRVAPQPGTPLRSSLRKDKVLVSFPRELANDQTYLLTVTRDIQDEHGNRLDRTYQLAFSTGENISEGTIEGNVFDRGGGPSTVYLYRVNDESLDSLFLEVPDYYTDTDDSGGFAFSFLEGGLYQLLALRGGSPPDPLVPERMSYGVPWEAPVEVSPEGKVAGYVNMKIAREVPPFRVVSVSMEGSRRGLVRFTNPVSLGDQAEFHLVLVDSQDAKTVVPDHFFQYRDGANELRFTVPDLEAGRSYELTLSGVKDSVGQILTEFVRPIVIPPADTTGPRIISPDPGKKVRLGAGTTPLEIQFNDVVQVEHLQDGLVIEDSSGSPLTLEAQWPNPSRLRLAPEGGWRQEEEYEVVLHGFLFRSPGGMAMSDSTVSFRIEIQRPTGSGGLVGSVVGRYRKDSRVVASSVEKPSISYSIAVNSTGEFQFSELPAGFWVLSVYQDRDQNGRYTYGKAVPFQPAEPFQLFPDTVEVRANWDVEGVL